MEGGIRLRDRLKCAAARVYMEFPDSPQGRLMGEVVRLAITDMQGGSYMSRRSAVEYLRGRMVHAELCDVDAAWIRRMIKKYSGIDV